MGQIGIILRGPDGSLIIPNPGQAGLQVQGGPDNNIIRSWSNGSQIETVRIEHTKVSPVNVANLGPKQVDSVKTNVSVNNKSASGLEGKQKVDKGSKMEGFDDIEMEVERSGEGILDHTRDFSSSDESGRQIGTRPQNTEAGSILNMKKTGESGNDRLNIGITMPNIGPVRNKFVGMDKADSSESMMTEDSEKAQLHAKNEVGGQSNPDLNRENLKADHGKLKPDSRDDQIDVTVFFDNNTDREFVKEVNDVKKETTGRKHGKFSSQGKHHVIEELKVQKGNRKSAKKSGHHDYIRLPIGPMLQQPDSEDEGDVSETTEEEDSSRSKGEIPEGDSDDNEDGDSTAPSMYDMRESLPFFSVPVADQRGYSLLTQVYDPFQDSPYPPGLDLVGADEQAPLLEDENDFFEPTSFKHDWKRSLPDSLPNEQKFSYPQISRKAEYYRQGKRKILRRRRGIAEQGSYTNSLKMQPVFSPSFGTKTRRATDIVSARNRFAELVRKIHERSVQRRSLLGLDNLPTSKFFGRHTFLSESASRVAQHRRRRSVLPKKDDKYESLDSDSHKSRRRRSIEEQSPDLREQKGSQKAENSLSNVAVYREKRDKIIEDDYDEDESSDFENEPHVVKRSAIFVDLDSSPTKNSIVMEDDGESRSKRQTDDDNEENDDDSEGERRQMPGQRVSSLEETLRKKLLSMKTQSKSVLKLLKRVHEDISDGNTNDLFKLEAEIADIEQRENVGRKPGEEERGKSHKTKTKKKKTKHTKYIKSAEQLKTKSVTPNIKSNSQSSSEKSRNDDAIDDAEEQEKLAYKTNPDEYLRYGAGNTGELESWTLVFYGT